ncbi:carboxyl-terminal processing protease [Aquibacillus albus]|uniref:Carboxyl-terminal processing protease n=1 Tax=Aquibacillus albus TaxID=1168171 RepID=A0ABS2N5Y6_9BACI|nr:S41 family peptidase [Aquibacillus albus]MBM7573523.1 carboxyl-terminal processing protease [Aquibacillus albus]
MNLKKSHIVVLMLAALLLGGVGSYIGVQLAQSDQPNYGNLANSDQQDFIDLNPDEQEELLGQDGMGDMRKVMQAYQTIQDNYLEKVEKNQLIEGAVQGMLDTLDDPYSVYMDKETVEEFNHQIESSFEGIGAEVSMVDDKVTIVAPIKDSPAEEAGLKPNDQILKVDDESIEGLDLFEAVSKIRGEQGSKVVLEISRPGVEEPFDVEIIRDDIPLETVYSETQEIDGKKAGIIEITSFSENTAERFYEELMKLEEEGIEGLVIDVRGNPGGLLPSVEEILKNFITKDQPYVQIEDRNGERSRYFSELEEPKDYPINVLIDEGSASASEILAIALKEAGNAEVVGTTSFGKGTVQQTIPMGDGSTIKLTLFKWLSPEGTWIHEDGVEPTIEVKQPDYFYTNPIQLDEGDTLKINESNDKVKSLQTMLIGLGFNPGRDDGVYSDQTEEAVRQYQKEQALEATGEVDQQTAERIQADIVGIIRSGENDTQKDEALNALFK